MKFIKKFTTFILMCTIIVVNTIPTFAATSTTITSKNEISDVTAKKIANEIISEIGTKDTYCPNKSIESKAVKTLLKFLRKNASKIEKILKKYGLTVAKGKGVITVIDEMLDGVISVDDSIDSVIYTIVDYVIPDASDSTKKIIANAIRLISPI